jgi:hypothetical protein
MTIHGNLKDSIKSSKLSQLFLEIASSLPYCTNRKATIIVNKYNNKYNNNLKLLRQKTVRMGNKEVGTFGNCTHSIW